ESDCSGALGRTMKPSVLREAMFSDVPYILDSIWRWMEFKAYRIGFVIATGTRHPFVIQNTTPLPFLLAFAVISSMVVFGPTFTTRCQGLGFTLAEWVRRIAGAGLILVALVMLMMIVLEICPRLVRRVAQSVAQVRPPSVDELATQQALDKMSAFGA